MTRGRHSIAGASLESAAHTGCHNGRTAGLPDASWRFLGDSSRNGRTYLARCGPVRRRSPPGSVPRSPAGPVQPLPRYCRCPGRPDGPAHRTGRLRTRPTGRRASASNSARSLPRRFFNASSRRRKSWISALVIVLHSSRINLDCADGMVGQADRSFLVPFRSFTYVQGGTSVRVAFRTPQAQGDSPLIPR